MKRLFKYLTYLFFALVLIYIAAAVTLHFIVKSKGNRYFAGLLSQATGYPTRVAGKVSLEFFPALGLRITHITFGNPKAFQIDAQVPYLAHADELDLKVSLPALLIGHVEPKRLYLKSANLYLAQNSAGQQNWAYKASTSSINDRDAKPKTVTKKIPNKSKSKASNFNLNQNLPQVLVSNSNFYWINRVSQEKYNLKAFNLTLSPNDFTHAFRFQTRFQLSQGDKSQMTTRVNLKTRVESSDNGTVHTITGLDLSGTYGTIQGEKPFSLSGDARIDTGSRLFEMKNMQASYAQVQLEGPITIHWQDTGSGRNFHEDFQGSFAEGRLKSTFTLNTTSHAFTWKTKASQINVSRLVQSFQPSLKIDGQLAFEAQLKGNLKQWRTTLSGQGHIELAKVQMKGINILGVVDQGISLLQHEKKSAVSKANNSFGSIKGDIRIQQGIASTHNLTFQSSKISGKAQGSINFAQRTLSLKIKARDERHPKWVIPLEVTGTFDAPSVSLDMASLSKDLIKSTIKNKVHDLMKLKDRLFH